MSLFENVTESFDFPDNLMLSLTVSRSVMVVSEVRVSLPDPRIRSVDLDSVWEVTTVPKSIVFVPRSILFFNFLDWSLPVTWVIPPSNCSVLLQKSVWGVSSTLPDNAGCSKGLTFSVSVALGCSIQETSS